MGNYYAMLLQTLETCLRARSGGSSGFGLRAQQCVRGQLLTGRQIPSGVEATCRVPVMNGPSSARTPVFDVMCTHRGGTGARTSPPGPVPLRAQYLPALVICECRGFFVRETAQRLPLRTCRGAGRRQSSSRGLRAGESGTAFMDRCIVVRTRAVPRLE